MIKYIILVNLILISIVLCQQQSQSPTQCEIKCQERGLTLQKCQQSCQSMQQNRQTNRIAIAIIITVIVIAIIAIIFFIFCWQKVKSKWYDKQQRQKRPVISESISETQFERQLQNFKNIFTQGQRDLWEFYYILSGNKIVMQWFSLDIEKVQSFQYKICIKGQDIRGQFMLDGYFLNSTQGITVWWFKQNHLGQSTVDSKYLIYSGTLKSNGNYTGGWYYRGFENVEGSSGEWKLCKIGSQSDDIELIYEVRSVPASDEILN